MKEVVIDKIMKVSTSRLYVKKDQLNSYYDDFGK